MRSGLPAVAVAILLVVAGCSGVVPSPDSGPDADSELTTAEPEYPPGVTADGLQDPETLLREHTESVRERGATLTSKATATIVVDGEPRTIDFEIAAWATPNATQVYYDTSNVRLGTNGTMRAERVEVYAADGTVHTRHVLDGNMTTTATEPRVERGDLVSLYVARKAFVRRALTGGTFEVVGTDRRNGKSVTILEAFDEAFTDDGRRVFHATVEVTADGRILSLSMRRNPDANTNQGRRTATVTWSVPPDPERPDWAT